MRALKVVGWGFISSGLLIFAFLAYQLWGTTFVTARAQDHLEEAFQERVVEVQAELPPLPDPTTIRAAAGDIEGSVREPDEEPPRLVPEEAPEGGAPLGRIVAPAANVDAVVVEGVERWQLKLGPGHFPGTPIPGQPGNAVLSGHRTTYGAPFYDLHLLQPGDEIVVETAIGKHVYQVRETLVVEPDDVWVLDDREGAWLTLTTCHPQFSARQRLVVFAEMVGGPNLLAVAASASS